MSDDPLDPSPSTPTGDSPEIAPVDNWETQPAKAMPDADILQDSEAITESTAEGWSGLDLPLVLIVGDSISMGYTGAVRQLLQGVALVERAPVNCGHSAYGDAAITEWLGNAPWSVVHFNFGLHDLAFRSPRPDAPVNLDTSNGVRQIPLEQYRMFLTSIVYKLQLTSAKLIWASTTPVPLGANGRRAGDEIDYNEAAAEIMREHQITINDLHAFASPLLRDIQLPEDVHFTEEGAERLAGEVARSIRDALRG